MIYIYIYSNPSNLENPCSRDIHSPDNPWYVCICVYVYMYIYRDLLTIHMNVSMPTPPDSVLNMFPNSLKQSLQTALGLSLSLSLSLSFYVNVRVYFELSNNVFI